MPAALAAGSAFPSITVPKVGGGTLDLDVLAGGIGFVREKGHPIRGMR